jgi:uncharacterized repeat protein (TIGR01451 family)
MVGRSAMRRSLVTVRSAVGSAAIAALLAMSLLPAGFVAAASPLAITNVDSPDPIQTGSQLTYTIVVTNTGGAKVNNVVLTDQYNGLVGFGNPPLLDAVSSRGTCTQNNTQVTCTAGTIEGGGSWTITIRGVVSAPGGTTINNNATVTGTKSAQTFTNSASATTLVTGTQPGGQAPDLTIAKNGPLSAAAGGPLTYTLTVNNVGTATATAVKVTDTLPTDFTFSQADIGATSLFQCAKDGQTVTCTGGQVNAGASATITIPGTVGAEGTLTNTAVVDPDDTIDEGVLGDTQDFAERNNTSNTVTTQVSPTPPPTAGPISITKERLEAAGGAAIPGGQAVPGESLFYRLTVTNGALGRADYVTLTDTTQGLQAASLSVLSATSSGGTTPACTVSAPIVTCTMSRLPANGTLTVEIRGMVVATAGSTIINNATATANIKNKGYSATDQVQTTIKPGFDLTITKADTPDPVCASSFPGGGLCQGGLRYDFVVSNSGILDAVDVVVQDTLPPSTTFDATASSPFCSVTGGVVTCTLASVPAEDSTAFHITLVAPPTTGSITNTVRVDPGNAIFESDETNNIATQATTVATGIDLTIAKVDETNDPGDVAPNFNLVDSLPGFDPIATSGTQTYTITVDNLGPQDATDIRVRDTLPSGTIFLAASADNDFACVHNGAATGGVVECTGGDIRGTNWESYDPDGPAGPNGPDSATIIVTAFARPTVGSMSNEVRVDPLGEIAEIDEQNNIATQATTVTNGDDTIGAYNELRVTKQQVAPAANEVTTSGVVTYRITVHNDGSDPAVNVVVRDLLPAGFTYIEAADTAQVSTAFFCSGGPGNTVECAGATLPGNGSRVIELRAFASSTPGVYTNQAIVDPGNLIPEGNETNNASSATTTVKVGTPTDYIDLRVEKTGPAGATPGSTISWTITVVNDGTNPAFNVVVRDNLPAGTSFVSAADDLGGAGAFTCGEAGGVIACTGGTLDGSLDLIAGAGTQRTLTFKATAPLANTTVQNQVVVDPSNAIPEGDETNNSATSTTTVLSKVNLTIEKTGPQSASQNSTETYTIKVTNEGADPAFDVEIVDPLPVGLIPLLAYASAPNQTDFACQVLENPINVVRCTGTLDGTGDQLSTFTNEVTINISVFITAQSGTLDNEACVDPDNTIVETEDNLDNCSTASTAIGKPDLSINKSADTASATPGQNVIYTLNVSNVGDGPTTSAVTISDPLAAGLTVVSASATNGFTCSQTAPISCTNGAAADNHPTGLITSVTITATVTATTGPITNTASVSQDAQEPAGALGNNSDNAIINIGGTGKDLVVVTYDDQPDPVPQGDSVTFTAAVTNAGSENASAVKITDVFSSLTGLNLVSATASQGFSCALDSGTRTVTCNGNLDAGATTIVSIVFQTDSTAPASVTSTLAVDPDDTILETNEANNDAGQVTTISNAICSTCIDLKMGAMIETPDPVLVNGNLVYTITVGNVGDQTTDTTANPDTLIFFDLTGSAEFSWISTTATNGFVCQVASTTATTRLTDCVGELGPGEGTIITITVKPTTAGSISATAFADPTAPNYTGPGTIPEFNESNNGPATATTTVNNP